MVHMQKKECPSMQAVKVTGILYAKVAKSKYVLFFRLQKKKYLQGLK